jgi:hypothetical protein
MPLRPYTNDHEWPYIVALAAFCVTVVLLCANGCHVDNKPRVSTWSPYQPPVVVRGASDDDAGKRPASGDL